MCIRLCFKLTLSQLCTVSFWCTKVFTANYGWRISTIKTWWHNSYSGDCYMEFCYQKVVNIISNNIILPLEVVASVIILKTEPKTQGNISTCCMNLTAYCLDAPAPTHSALVTCLHFFSFGGTCVEKYLSFNGGLWWWFFYPQKVHVTAYSSPWSSWGRLSFCSPSRSFLPGFRIRQITRLL